MGGKKKKGARRISLSELELGDAFVTQKVTESSRKDKAPSGQAPPPPPPQTDLLGKDSAVEKDRLEELLTSPLVAEEIPTEGVESPFSPSQLKSSRKGGDGKCQHVKSAVKVPKIRSKIAHIKDWNHCHGCLNAEARAKKLSQRRNESMADPSLTDTENAVGSLPSESLWMCLSCYAINCGRTVNEHALTHHVDMKGNHPLSINLGTMECWCYDCDSQIVPSKNKNQLVQECQAVVKETLQLKQSKIRAASATAALSGSKATVVAATPKTKVFTPGLQNLGNTCFFNSVVQILVETKSLKSILSENGSYALTFPDSLAARTNAGLGPLTISLKEFLRTMWKQQGGTIAPKELFNQIARKWKVFKGYKQQDSQELMRYLFDGVKQEELDMIKRQLSEEETEGEKALKGTQVNRRISATNGVSTDDKDSENTRADETVEAAPKYVPFIDSCFSGKLVSVIVCDTCKKCSYAPENFFDLSLPVRGPAQARSVAGSSRLLAQSRKTEPDQSSITPESSTNEEDPIPASEKPSEAHMRHIEKLLRNVGQFNSETLSIQRSLNQFSGVDCLDGDNKFACENCYKLIHGSKDNVDEALPLDCTGGNDAKESGIKELGVDSNGHTSDKDSTEIIKVVDEPENEINESDKVSEAGAEDGNEEDEEGKEDEENEEDEQDEEDEEDKDHVDRFGNTIPKAKVDRRDKDKEEAPVPTSVNELKFIFRKAYKRYLISELPPTLVLHLKRFEQSGRFGQTRKIEDHVDIPVELDMSPYFVPKGELEEEDEDKNLAPPKQHIQDDGVSKKYRLFGAVVHMGSLGGGHYTNYVLSSKVAAPEAPKVTVVTKADKKVKSSKLGQELLDIPSTDSVDQQKESKDATDDKKSDPAPVEDDKKEEKEEKEKEEEAIDTRQWISCSDSSVRLSSLEEVLASRAYLLFYERC